MKHYYLTSLLILASLLVFYGCQQSPSDTMVVTDSPMVTPSLETQLISPQSTPTMINPLPTPSSADVAVVSGVLLRDLGNGDVRPMAETTVHLAKIISSLDGSFSLAAAGEGHSPASQTTQWGQFVFTDIPPGNYSIAVATPVGSFLIKDANGDDIRIEVGGGEVIDAGEYTTDLQF